MPALITKGSPGIERALMIDGISFSMRPGLINATPEATGERITMLDGLRRESKPRPHFAGIPDADEPYVFTFPYDALEGEDLIAMKRITSRGNVHRLTLWRMECATYTLPAATQRVYLPRLRKCATHLYSGVILGTVADPTYEVTAEHFPVEATLNGDALTVTFAEGPALVSPGAGGIVIAKQPDTAPPAVDRTAMLLGDAIVSGDVLEIWMPVTFEVTMGPPRIDMHGNQESHELVFVEI